MFFRGEKAANRESRCFYSHDPIMANYRDHGFPGVIAKPYRIREMSEVVSKVIAMVP